MGFFSELDSGLLEELEDREDIPESGAVYPLEKLLVEGAQTPVEIVFQGQPESKIPLSPKTVRTSKQGKSALRRERGLESRMELFMKQARAFSGLAGAPCRYVSFASYWPTYSAMNERQRAWYFYWRSMAKKGQYLKTDRSYLYLFFYELINGFGYDSAEGGFRLFKAVWDAYRTDFPKLDVHLKIWAEDFLLLHNLWETTDPLPEPSGALPFDLYLQRKYLYRDEKLIAGDFLRICSYSYTKSPFYSTHANKLTALWEEALIACDEEMRGQKGMNLLRLYKPDTSKKLHRTAYANAVYGGRDAYTVSYLPFSQSKALLSVLDGILKEVENRLRKELKFQGKLRFTSLPEELTKVIDRIIPISEKHAKKKTAPLSPKVVPQAVTLDTELLKQLRRESDEILRLLVVEEEEASLESEPICAAPRIPEAFILEDNGEILVFAENLPLAYREALALLLKGNPSGLNELADRHKTLPELLLDEINERFQGVMGDILIDASEGVPRILEEYQDALKEAFA